MYKWKVLITDYQLYLTFISGSYVILINIPVFNGWELDDIINIIENDIANSVRIYGMPIDMDFLQKQIMLNQDSVDFVINDTSLQLSFTIPFWLNINAQNRYDLFAAFPDINNISNALCFAFYEKSQYKSFRAFENIILKDKKIEVKGQIQTNDNRITRYEIIDRNRGVFFGQYIFIKCANYYGMLNFTATETTYDKNIDRLNECGIFHP